MTGSALARRPASSLVAEATAAGDFPSYVTREQARAIINAAETRTQRLLLETLWQTGGRVTEVLRLRPADVVDAEGAISLENLKQRDRRRRRKLVYVSQDLIAQLRVHARDLRLPQLGFYFQSRQSEGMPMSYEQCWRVIRACAQRAGVQVLDGKTGRLRPANGRDFRHGAAVHQVRQGVPLSEVQQQLGHARVDSTTIYTRLANPERRRVADRVEW